MMETYPVLLLPTSATASNVIFPSRRKNKKHGPTEFLVLARLVEYGCEEIREDVCVKIDGHNYEPDFAYVNEEKGVYIDIEVDEPYSVSGRATHYLMENGTNRDSLRNKRFQDAGWYVVCFSEEQIFCHTKECIRKVYDVALSAGAISEYPKALQDVPDLQQQNRWLKADSYRMLQRRYRQSYLGFDPARLDLRGALRCATLLLPVTKQFLKSARVRRELLRQLWKVCT